MVNMELKAALVRQAGSQANAAEALKVDESVLSRWVRGRRRPDEEQRERLKAYLGKDFFAKAPTEAKKQPRPRVRGTRKPEPKTAA